MIANLTHVVLWGRIGDGILATAAIKKLRKTRPQDTIILYHTPRALHNEIFRNNPNVDFLFPFNKPTRWFLKQCERLRWGKVHYLSYAATINKVSLRLSMKDIFMQLLGEQGVDDPVELFLTADEEVMGRELLRNIPRPIVGINANAGSTPHKNWPYSHWEELVRRNPRCQFVQLGATSEPPIAGTLSFLGVPLRTAFSILKSCDAFVGVDSMLAHAAVGVKTPGIILYGPTDSGVWGHRENINLNIGTVCSPCMDLLFTAPCPFGKECMEGLTVDIVSKNIEAILSRRAAMVF